MTATSAPTAPARLAGRRSLGGRLLVSALGLISGVLQRLPDTFLHRLAHRAGGLLYRAQPDQRRLVRANLEQVCRYLADKGLLEAGSAAAAAAHDERALDRLVRTAFGHYVRTYLEVALMPAYARSRRSDRIVADDPPLVAEAFGLDGRQTGPIIVVALHFGAIEIPALWGVQHGLRVSAPMETLGNPKLQAYLARSRGASGLRIVPARGAARELTAALGRGEVVAIVADRLVAGSGARVELFGKPARLPIGPAALALESGAATWLVTARRVDWGKYRAHLERIDIPGEGSRRERLARGLDAQARAFERAVALAPEQWWAIFFPIWSDPVAGEGVAA